MFASCAKKSETITAKSDDPNGSYAKILNGDLSGFAGTWVDGFGTRSQLRADGVFTGGSMSDLEADGFSVYDYGAYYWNVRSTEGYGGFGVMVYPPGVPINIYDGSTTDTTKVRIIAGHDGPSSSAEVYYREGEAPAAHFADEHEGGPGDDYEALPPGFGYPYTAILDSDLSDFAGTWVNGRGERRQLRANGTFNAGETAYGFKRGNENDQHIAGTYYQWIVNMGGEAGGFEVWLYPAGAAVRIYIEDYGWDVVATHNTMDRIFVESVGSSYDVYYREGELRPPSDDWVLGSWMFKSGSFVNFFGQAPSIDFLTDKTVNVYEQGDQSLRLARSGIWGYTPEGRLFVEYNRNTYLFTFSSDMENLIIIDSDGDRGVFGKVYG